MSDDLLNAGRWESMERMSGFIARTHPTPTTPDFGYLDKHEAAMDALVEYVAERGWPDGEDFKPMMAFAAAAVNRAWRESVKHLAHAGFWVTPPIGEDSLGEKITDRIGVWQLAWMLTDREWRILWCAAETIRRGGAQSDAAALAGMRTGAYKQALRLVRLKCWAAWVAPGETLVRKYSSIHADGKRSKPSNARASRMWADRQAA